jgi:hypothetical protein
MHVDCIGGAACPPYRQVRVPAVLMHSSGIRSEGFLRAPIGLLVAIIVAVSTILTAALLTIGVAFVALLACRTVYPVADRLDPPAEEPTP